MKKAKTFARGERETKKNTTTTLINNKQAKRLALLSVYKTGYEYGNT